MAALTEPRRITDQEIREHEGLVRSVIARLFATGKIAQHVEHDDLLQVGMVGLWKALQRWEPDRGTVFASFAWPTIFGEIMRHQRDTGRAHGWHRNDGQIAHIGSIHEPVSDDVTVTVADTLIATDDIAETALDRAQLHGILQRAASLPPRDRFIAEGIFADRVQREDAERLGYSQMHVSRLRRRVQTTLTRDSHTVEHGVLLIDRTVHPTEAAARAEAARIRPGCVIYSVTARKVRDGRVSAPQGRARKDGSLGRPVWAIELSVKS